MIDTQTEIGIIGLGIMGSAYASRLLANGFSVLGFDVFGGAVASLVQRGGRAAASPAEVAASSDVVLLALPSAESLEAVTGEIAACVRPRTIICELGTLPLVTKEACWVRLEQKGAVLLDCPVSGTGAQAALGDIVVYASGDEASCRRVEPVLKAMARDVHYCGPFGTGMKLKLVANLLVTIHNTSTAEALLLAERAGLDLQLVFDAIRSGAGNSRMFEVRGPMMIAESYEPVTMKMDVFLKDIDLIMGFARDVQSPIPLMSASANFYLAALAAGKAKQDTAAVFSVLKSMTVPLAE